MKFPDQKHSNIELFLRDYSRNINDGFDSIDIKQLDEVATLMNNTIKNGNKIFTCGNGGSSAISEHFVCDFLKGASTNTSIQPIIHSLTSNTPTLTAVANDIDYAEVFSFQLEKYAKQGDILICISSSGNSPNIIQSIKSAKKRNIKTISFVGFSGGRAKELSDLCIHIENNNYGIVEDIHQSLMHLLAQFIRLKNLDNIEDVTDLTF